jgi:hypothetical protein
MAQTSVPAGGNLQAALDTAAPGDVITLPAGATFLGQYRFPPKAGPVTLTSASTLPVRRITPADAGLLATLGSSVAAMAADFAGSSNWILDGIRFLPNPSGAGEVIRLQGSDRITFKRVLLVVPSGAKQKRFITGNGTNVTLTQSHCQGVWTSGQDSQCFAAWDGAGPYSLTDNSLEAASENVMFGGADASSPANIPSDILIERNLFTKDLAWKGDGISQVIKNLLELKNAKRVIIRDNMFEHCWGGEGQSGAGIVFTPRNQDGTNPYAVVSDVLFERNVIRDVGRGINISGYDDLAVSQQTTNIVIRDNDIQSDWFSFITLGEIGTLAIYRNTLTVPVGAPLLYLSDEGSIMTPTGSRSSTFAVQAFIWDNIAVNGYIHSPTATGTAALAAYTESYSLQAPPVDPTPVPVVTDADRIRQALAILEPMASHLTGKDLTNLKNILTRLKTLLGSVQ